MKEEAIKAPGSTIKQYSIMLQNRVGALTALLGLLDMHGISVWDSACRTAMRRLLRA